MKPIISSSPSVVCTHICIRACVSLLSGKNLVLPERQLPTKHFFSSSKTKSLNFSFFKTPHRETCNLFSIKNLRHWSYKVFNDCVFACVCQTVRGVQVQLRRNRRTGKSFLSSSPPARPPVCGPSCASAWRPGSGRSPGRWCTGTETLRCVCAGAWS